MHIFKNFKNFADVEIDLSKPMTLLIGRNGSGKSNLIEGVELLGELLSEGGIEIHEISDIGRGGRFEIRGGLNGCFRKGSKSFEIACKGGGHVPDNFLTYKEYSFDSLFKFCLEPNIKLEIIHLKWIQHEHVSSFEIYPKKMREYSSVGLKELNRNCANISSVLYYLHQEHPEILELILGRIKQLPEEAFERFDFITTSDNSDVLFALRYPNGETISAKLLSDGTLRALAVLTALETVTEGSRIIVEEIDNGVHASRVHVLIEAIWEASNRRKLNTLITTHNPATLDSLTDEQLECVVVCHYDKESQSAKLTSFFELPNVDVLLQKGKLGGLVTRNIVERYLDPEFKKKQKKIALEWLESAK